MKAKNIAILLFSAVIGCAVAKTYSSLQEEGGKTTDVRKERKTNVKKDVVSESVPTVEHETESVQAEVAKPSYGEYASLQKSGVVGLYGGNSIDNPEDNIFEVVIPSSFSSSDKVVLSYDVEGVAGSTGVALSINDRTAMGGMVAYSSDKRSSVNEEIDAAWLVKGKNRIMFTLPDSANYGYRVSNLKIAISANTASGNIVATASKLDGEVYVRGFVKNAKAKSVNIAGKEYELTHGSFEALISGDDEDVRITCGDASKTFHATTVSGCIASTRLICVNKSEKQTQKEFSLAKKENNKVQDVAATLNVDSGVVKKDMKITMTNLRHKDLPALDLGMTNVTDGVEGYRFLPHGAHFDGEGAVVSLKYDRTKIPSGYTENDIRTYYFDLDTKHWVALKRDSIDKENNLIVSRTNHFTDMINGVIQAPESPETQGFTPTMMSDLKLADPTAKIQSIAPPTANNRGSANLSYSFEMPPARHGMQPSLGIQYNSDGGTGLLGEGWDLSVPTISVETRWGVPRYDDILETETYLMDGSMLVLDNGGVNYLAHRALNQIKRSEVKRTDGAVIFHPRKEGSFSKIVRLGNSPAEYTWVVTDKSGTKYYYGKKNADGSMKGVLMGKNYEGNDVIAEWKLVRIQEVHGDWIEYEYEEKNDAVSTNVVAKTLYLSKITAGNSGEKAHTEVVVNKDIRKRKVQRMGNYGFLVSNPYLLKSVEIKYEGNVLRSYEFKYNHQAPFLADLLEKIIHKDANGDVVSENTMTYHDKVSQNGIEFVSDGNIYQAESEDLYLFGPDEYGVLGGVRMLGGTTSNTFSTNAFGGVGPNTQNPLAKSLTVGANFSFSRVTNRGVISLIDIDGDGLADKVYKVSKNKVCYRPYLPDKKEYGNEVEIKGIDEISKSTCSTITFGGNANAIGGICAGISRGNVDAETSTYFSDVNGDGLVDLVVGSSVYFNRLVDDPKQTNGKRKVARFYDNSNAFDDIPATPNPIVSSLNSFFSEESEKIKENDAKRREEKQNQKNENSPMQDVVRVWEAPYSGSVAISGNPTFAGTDNSDGVAVSVQFNNKYILNPVVLNKNNTTVSCSKSLTVVKGDKIYFRVQSGTTKYANGEGDMVKWQPVVTYSDSKYQTTDPNGLSLARFSSEDGFMLSSSTEGLIDTEKQRPATLKLKLNKDVTTDDVKVVVILHNDEYYEKLSSDGETYESVKNNDYRKENVVTYDLSADQTISEEKNISLNEYIYQSAEHPLKYISCRLESSTNIDWSKVSFSAIVEYGKLQNEKNNTPSLGVPVFISAYTSNDYFGGWKTSYGENIEDETSYTVKVSETEEEERTISKADLIQKLELTPKINFELQGALNVSAFRMAFKNEAGELLGNIKLNYSDGVFSAIKVSDYQFLMNWFAQATPEKLWIEYYVDLFEINSEEDETGNSFKVNSSGWTVEAYEFTEIEKTKTDEYGNEVTYTETVKNQIYESSVSGLNVVSNLLDESFGPMYRGWGQFAYSAASDRYGKNIDETRLGASAYNDMTDGYDPENPESFEYDKDKLVFIAMQPDFLHDRWNGQASYELGDDTITNSVGKELMITARQGEQDVTVADPFASVYSGISLGGKGIAFSIISESKSTTTQRGIGGYTKNVSDGTSATIQSSVDMNGDGYPDLIKDSNIFYTGHLGGFDGVTKNFGEISLSDNGDSHSESSAFGSGTIHAIPGMVKQFRAAKSNNNVAADESASEKARAKINASFGSSENKERTTQTKMDINGDGLLDIVSNIGSLKVRLNLGYDFSPEIVWGIYPIRSVSAEDKTIGGSVDFCGSSYSAGLNASGSTSFIENDLIDVNGDGLPDLLTNDAVFLNTGFGFGERVSVKNLSSVGTSTSINGSVNGNATASIPAVFVRFVISGGAAFGKGLSGEEASIRDFDGDGYPDLVTSDSKNSIKVDTSNIGATNKLKSVTTPFGGRYELEYIHSTPTQQHPGGKWVMSKLTVTDTKRDKADCPSVVTEFDYSGGKRDRRERDFYGFAEVRTKRMNVNEEGNSVVESQIVQNYDTTNYYTSGTAIGSYVCDAAQKQFFSKETSKLNIYDVSGKGNVTNGREVSATASFDENGRYFVAPVKSTTMRFEPKNENGESGENGENENKDDNVTTNIVENKYGNFGNLTEYKYTDGITNASYTTTIQYKDYDEETGVFGLPIDVVVKSGDQTMRHVSAEYDMLDNNKESGYNPTSMTKMTQYLGRETAEVEFKYDTLGNIIEKIMPQATGGNLMNKRMTYTYEYDKKHRMYPTRVTDGFGYRSDMFNYDYRYGIPLSVKDMNGFITEYEIDDLGRVTKVTAPNELSSGAPYTIKYEYFSGDKIRMAKTYHYDPQHEDQAMITVNIVDGFGRELQARKSAEIDGDDKFMIVSGKTTFDALGRELSHYAPTTCLKSEMENLTCNFSDLKLDLTTYDAFDRPNEKTVYDEKGTHYVTKMEYSIDDDKLKTTITDAEGMVADAYTDGTEHTLKTVKNHKKGGDPATTEFDFDGIGQLLKVTDPAGKFTEYTYDMAGRKLSVDNLSAGKTTFTYDNLGNVLTKTTGKGDVVTYKYEYNRLVEQIYGNDKWKNNVKYTYGGVDAKHNRVGRLALVEDGSGAQEYFYGKMGEVEKIRRTIIIPGVDVATYTTEWKYDSWNRIQEMIYPDGEKIKYYYNLGGQLKKILGQKNYICTYIDEIKYDEYEQRSFIRYGNGTETTYKYEDGLRRLKNMTVANKEEKVFLNNTYTYDKVNNILSVVNAIDKEKALNAEIGGTTSHTYTYDDWHRLKTATGEFNSFDGNKSANYHLEMGYDNLYNITSKKLTMTQTNLQFAGTLSAGHEFSYNYSTDNPMQLASVETKQYNVDGEVSDVDAKLADNQHVQSYEFDDNGNMVSVSVAKNEEENPEGEQEATEEKDVLKSFLWDEENRLLAVNNNGSVSCYFYDAAGERTVKLTSESEMVHVNGKKVGGNANICKFTAYVSPYFVVSNGGAYTKHIYAASQRIASKLGNEDGFGADPRRVEQAGGKKISDIQTDNIGARYKELGFTYSAPEKEKVVKDSTMDSEAEEKLIFFYHPDHLGSTSYVTDADGNIAQHVEYIPYGEVFVEERNNSFSTNFLFNAKELDNETGLYYYGARYLDPTGGMWLSVDPMWEKYAGMSPYNYCAGNPVNATDPTGMFKVKQYSDEELNNFNLERSELERFESIVKNADKLLNQQVLDVIYKTTGVSVDQIKKDFKYGDGPTIAITSTWLAEGNNETITICADAIKWLASTNASDIDDKAKCKMLSRNVMAVAMFIFHEYGHIGDQRTNGGMNSGQKSDGMNDDCDVDYGSTKSIREGKQEWKRAKTGHRGIDVTKLGFKADVSITNSGEFNIIIPNSSPYLKNNAILKILNVK